MIRSHIIGLLFLITIVSFGKKLCFFPKVILSFSFEEKDNVSSRRFGIIKPTTISNYYGRPGNIQKVFMLAQPIRGLDTAKYRMDITGEIIQFSQLGKTNIGGWNIIHIIPHSQGGTDHISNLQPLNIYDYKKICNNRFIQ
jgi:hypothetical protein